MANPEHVEIVKRGAAATRKWQLEHPDERLDLYEANLAKDDLSGVQLVSANLHGANLNNAILRDSFLALANLARASLNGADLRNATLWGTDLSLTRIVRADLSGARLLRAKLDNTDLTESNLDGTDISLASLFGTILNGANLYRAQCAATTFADCDLSRVRGLETVCHDAPSSIGVDTLIGTLQGTGGQFTAEQREFFENAGVPKTLLDYLPSLLEDQPIQFFSCFVSYGSKDETFANRLYRDLKERGIRCWKYDADAIIGREVWTNISHAIVLHEKMIVVCSESSLQRPGVQGEIERALQKEEQLKKEKAARGDPDMDTDVLVPVRLDDYVLNGWEHPRKADVIKKHIGDFRDWQDEAKYKKAFERLLRALDPRSKLGLSK